jgi:hypothetical protein
MEKKTYSSLINLVMINEFYEKISIPPNNQFNIFKFERKIHHYTIPINNANESMDRMFFLT